MNSLGPFGWLFCLGAPVLSLALLPSTKLMLLPLLCWFAVVGLCVLGVYMAPRDPDGENQGYVLYTLMLLLITWSVFGMVLVGAGIGWLLDRRAARQE